VEVRVFVTKIFEVRVKIVLIALERAGVSGRVVLELIFIKAKVLDSLVELVISKGLVNDSVVQMINSVNGVCVCGWDNRKTSEREHQREG
jgi:hypothetical protein